MNVNQHGGEVMGFPRVRAVYWGSAYGSTAGGLSSLALSLDSFFTTIFPTPYFGFLAEYSVNTPTFLGSVWLPHDPTQMLTLSTDDAKNTITAWLDSGLLPEVPGRTETNLLYVIFYRRRSTRRIQLSAVTMTAPTTIRALAKTIFSSRS